MNKKKKDYFPSKISSSDLSKSLSKEYNELVTIYKYVPIGLCVLDKNLCFVRVNKKLAEINGETADAHIGKPLKKIMPDIYKQSVKLTARMLRSKNPIFDVEMSGKTLKNPTTIHHFKTHWLPLKDESGDIFAYNVVVEEITLYKRLQRKIEEYDERLHLAMKAGGMFAFEWNPNTDEIIRSPESMEILGIDDSLVKDAGTNHFSHIPSKDREEFQQVFKNLTPKNDNYSISYRFQCANDKGIIILGEKGRAVFDSKGKVKKVYGLVADITKRKIAEDRLEHQRELLQKIINNIPVMITIYDPQLKQFTFNKSIEKTLGWKIEDAMDGNFMKKVYPDKGYRKTAERFMTSSTPGWRDFNVTTKDGNIVESSWANIKLTDDTIIGIGIDMRERIKAEKELRESQERLRLAQQAGHIGVFDWDLTSGEIRWSPEVELMFGMKFGSFKGTYEDWIKHIHPGDLIKIQKQINEIRSSTALKEAKWEHRIIRDDGEIRWISGAVRIFHDTHGKIKRILGTKIDITESRKLQDELASAKNILEKQVQERTKDLQEANEILERVFSTSNFHIAYMDKNFNFIRVNRAYAKNNKKSPEYFIGKDHFTLFPNQENKKIFKEVVKSGETFTCFSKPFEYAHQKSQGVTYWDWTLQPVKNEQGAVHGLILFLVDVTKRKRAEMKLEESRNILNNMKRLSDIGELAATVAHELRNPLASINMSLFNIRRKTKNKSIESNLKSVEKKIVESEQIIDNLLFYSRIKKSQREKVDVYKVVSDCLKEFAHFKGTVKLLKDILPIKNVRLKADPVQLHEVFINILNNALDAVDGEKGYIKISAKSGPKKITVTIEDNGPGIPKNIIQKACDPFFTTKAKGTGLGLAVCQQIINLHQGTLKLTSKKTQGARVTITLPR